ncbi:MAG: SMC-Scp complex subunit ScpB [Candidatus Moranbacteria bacterium]|nr:SMC-Scp complex subunit ScpB [Candidatus Moranbacteria bacterium]
MDSQKLKSILESLLFVSGEPIGAQKLAKISGIPKNEVEVALAELEKEYQGNRGLRILSSGGSYQLASSPENSQFVNQLVSGELNADLSKSAVETLSIVAYRGPITRVQIEAIRGVNCTYVLRSLLVRGLVERKETTDIRGYLYEISFDFLKYLGIQKAGELPDWETLSKNDKVSELLEFTEKEQ